ncbi:regulator of G-protein signaling 10 isoform X3 [Saccopteryx leptura]|uniref:regulator of G-protein signaling 10 isoform X3 n=1 Tax=Saccopteryx leptura TaxID=249018 RepID=UPI00339CC29C
MNGIVYSVAFSVWFRPVSITLQGSPMLCMYQDFLVTAEECSHESASWRIHRMQEKAKEIYMTFLSSKASSQVNVEGQSRLNEKILEEPHPLMFQRLQDQIFNLMKYDSYSRFLKSDLFLKHKRTEEEEEEPPDAQTAAKRASRIYNT